jgi:hypothetical protein
VYDSASCAESSVGKTVLNSPFLWVVGAGNDGERIDVASSRSCPSNLGARENLIVVAASHGDEDWISGESTYGSQFADIVADGMDPASPHGKPATSYSTPRVSAVAADLARKFPTLSVAAIRMALLTSAHIREGYWGKLQPAEVRSGGFLNPDKAEVAASLLASRSSWIHSVSTLPEFMEMKKFFSDLYCESDSSNECVEKTDERIRILIKNGVVHNAYCPEH